MAVNKAFHTSNLTSIASERNLYKDLIKEAIQIHGHDVYYVDRTAVALDNVLGEDALAKYRNQQPIEMYVEDAESGYAGDKELMTQFGLDNRNEITFVVHKERFQELTKQFTIEDGTDTTGGSIQMEDATTTITEGTVFETFGTDIFYLLNETDATDADRPLEGDLVYHPVLGKMFEIGFVDHDAPFHQLDNNPIYKLRCRQYEYDMSRLDTGIAEIDSIEDSNSTDALVYQFTLENEVGSLQLENDADTGLAGYLISEEYIIGDMDTDKSAQNEFITQQITNENILDFSEKNPFGDAGA
mgnify:FL=1|jgi:hypothetical protein|tara:strand:+ start:448 stop:1347 length:900 start_codon:yes stop_codon:yes gene_type:complete